MKTEHIKPIGCNKDSSQREMYSSKHLHLKRESQINNLNLYLTKLEKEEQDYSG